MAALCLQFVMIAKGGVSLYVSSAAAGRSIGTLNNPNQLGYYGVLTFSLFLLFHWQRVISLRLTLALYGVTGLLTAMSLSKSALLGMMLMGASFFRGWKLMIFVALTASFVLIFPLVSDDLSSLRVVQRLMTIGSSEDDTLVRRGYGPLLDPDWRLALGWGEGYVLSQVGHETHSTLGNILISYGLVGFGLFVGLMLCCFRALTIRHGLVAAFVLMAGFNLYGIAHNGIRFTSLWVLLALILSIPYISARQEQPQRHGHGVPGAMGADPRRAA